MKNQPHFAVLALSVLLGSCGSNTDFNYSGQLYDVNDLIFRSSYRYAVVPEATDYSHDVKRALQRAGLHVLVGSREQVLDQYVLERLSVLEIACAPYEERYLADARLKVDITCEAMDIVSEERVYRGWGTYTGPPSDYIYNRAAYWAFRSIPGPGPSGDELAELPFRQRSFRERSSAARPAPPRPVDPAPGPRSAGEYSISGTAFFVSGDGYLLTNQHVIDGCSRLRIFYRNAFRPVRAEASDVRLDLAVLKWNGAPSGHAAFRSGRFIRSGESVVAIGYPLRGLLADEATVTAGIVNSMAGIGNDRTFMQISAPVQSGNSGGPLLDEFGNVVGVVVAKLDAASIFAATGDLPQNVNFAINGQLATDFLNANGVPYELSASTATLSPADIADVAKRYTVPLECALGR